MISSGSTRQFFREVSLFLNTSLFALACMIALTTLLASAAHADSPVTLFPWGTEGSVRALVTQSYRDGQSVVCEATVDRIAARNNPAYFVLRDELKLSGDPDYKVVVLCSRIPLALRCCQAVRVTGELGRLPNNEVCIINPVVEAYVDQNGALIHRTPFDFTSHNSRQTLPFPTGPIPPSDASLSDDGTGVSGAVSANVTQGVSRYDTIASFLASAPPVLSQVELSAKPITGIGEGYVTVGDDNSESAVRVYTNLAVKSRDRLIKLKAVVHSEAGQLCLYAGAGQAPFFDAQGLDAAGSISVASPGTVAYAGTLRDTTPNEAQASAMRSSGVSAMSLDNPTSMDGTWVYLTGQVVTGIGKYYTYDRAGHGFVPVYYIQGLDRTPGIRVVDMSSSVSVGNIVDVMAEIDTKDGERLLGIIDPWTTTSVESKVLDTSQGLLPQPIGMSNNKALGGSGLGNNPGIVGDPYGPYNIGSYVRVWGKVLEQGTYQFEWDPYNATIPYMRVDDGSAVLSGNSEYGGPYGAQGITIFGTNTYNGYPTVNVGDYIAVTGISSIWKPDGSDNTYRAIWTAHDVQNLATASSGSIPSYTGTISGTVTLYDMTTSSVDVTLFSSFGKMQTLTVTDGNNDHIGTASYSWTNIPLYDSNWNTVYYIVSAKADGYKTRTYTEITPWTGTATPKNFYLVPPRKIYLNTQDNRTYIGPCSPMSLNIGATVLDDSHNPIVYDQYHPLNGGTVRFVTTAGSFNPTTLQQTISAHTNASGAATVTLYGVRWAGSAAVSATDDWTTPAYTDAPTTDDTYHCDWETLPNTISIYAPSVYVNMTATPSTISRCGSTSAVVAHVTLCSSLSPTGTTVNFALGTSDPCVFISETGVTVSPDGKSATANTNASGDAAVHVRADDAHHYGNACVSASASVYAGSESASVYVSVAQYSTTIQAQADPSEIYAAGSSTITFTATDPINQNQAVVDVPLTIGTTAGTFVGKTNPFTQSTDSNGRVTVTLNLNPAQSAAITATYTDACLGSTSINTQVVYRQTPWNQITTAVGASCPLVDNLFPGDGLDVGVIGKDGYVHIWNNGGTEEWTSPDYIDGEGNNTLSCADLDNNGGLQITAPANGWSGYNNQVYAYGYDLATETTLRPLAGWPALTPLFPFKSVATAIGDINLDGTPKIVAGDYSCYVVCWNAAGGNKQGANSRLWVQLTDNIGTSIIKSSVAIGDVNSASSNNHILDAICGGQDSSMNPWSFAGDEWYDYSASNTYDLSPGWQQVDHLIQCSPVIGQLVARQGNATDNDVAVGDDDGGMLVHLNSNQAAENYWQRYAISAQPIQSSPIIVNLDSQKCLVFGCNDGRVYAIHADGSSVSGWAGGIQLNAGNPQAIQASPLYGNVVSGTMDPQVIVACTDGNVYALWKEGANHSGGAIARVWTCAQSGGTITSTPTLCSLDGVHLDMIVASSGGVYRIRFDGSNGNPNITFDASDYDRWPWRTFHYDNARTGCCGPVPTTKVSASVIGVVKQSNVPVTGATVTVQYYNISTSQWMNDTSVYQSMSGRPVADRTPVITVGTTADELNKGGFVINQLIPNRQYRLQVQVGGSIVATQNVNNGTALQPGRYVQNISF